MIEVRQEILHLSSRKSTIQNIKSKVNINLENHSIASFYFLFNFLCKIAPSAGKIEKCNTEEV